MQGGNLQHDCEKPSRAAPNVGGSSRSSPEWRRGSGGGNARERPDLPEREPRRTVICSRVHEVKTDVPLKVWVLASASCFAVCAALVLATVAITKWGSVTTQVYPDSPPSNQHQHNSNNVPSKPRPWPADHPTVRPEEDVSNSILERLSMFKNIINRSDKNAKKETLIHKPQYHPELDSSFLHSERKIEKKDQPDKTVSAHASNNTRASNADIPEFKPTLPDVFVEKRAEIKLPDGYVAGLRKYDNDYYTNDIFYEDDPLYDDYVQSNSMTNYLIEKIQELYDWVTTDPELEGVKNSTERVFRKKGENASNNELGQLLRALNESVVEGNITIVMLKLRELYFGNENLTNLNINHRTILTNTTDLLSFGMLTLDVMLLHNIHVMAWETQESSGLKMLQDPEVFAFNALFLEPTKIEAKRQEVLDYRDGGAHPRRQELAEDSSDVYLGRGVLEEVLELGLSAARAAVHLGRAYKNAKSTLKQISNREFSLQNHLAKNSDSNTFALNHLRSSYDREQNGGRLSPSGGRFPQSGGRMSQNLGLLSHNGGIVSPNDGIVTENGGENTTDANTTDARVTELDCIWFLYCKNLVATSKLGTPFGTMARINGVALRLIAGELPAERALETLATEAISGWTELHCADMLPRCSHGEAATVVLESIARAAPAHRRGRTGAPKH